MATLLAYLISILVATQAESKKCSELTRNLFKRSSVVNFTSKTQQERLEILRSLQRSGQIVELETIYRDIYTGVISEVNQRGTSGDPDWLSTVTFDTTEDVLVTQGASLRIREAAKQIKNNMRFIKLNLDDEIKRTSIPGKQIAAIKKYSLGISTLEDFVKSPRDMRGGVLLGHDMNPYDALARYFRLDNFLDLYRRQTEIVYDGPWSDPESERFMEMIEGRPIVFLIPATLKRDSTPITYREFSWLLARPQTRMANVFFIVGAYHSISGTVDDMKKYEPYSRLLRAVARSKP